VNETLELLALPFVLALCLVGIHTYFGIQVLRRNVVFVDLALAQIAALGATVAFMLGHPAMGAATHGYALAFTLLAALLLAFTRQWSGRIVQEALIGVIYVVAAAAALLLIDRAPQGAEHLKQILTGSILTGGRDELVLIVPVYVVVAFVHWLLRRRLLAAADLDWRWEFLFYATFGVVVTSSVAIAGVLLVFSFLIVPAAIGLLHADRLLHQLVIGWGAGAAASLLGLAASYIWDLPSGATMVCAFGLALAAAGLAYPFTRGGARAASAALRMLTALRWFASVALFASAAWLLVAPRADQPLADALELAAPAVRGWYMDSRENDLYQDAKAHAERYREAAERLNDTEARSRYQGKALDDYELARVASFLKSYHEMRRGEEFVMREMRSRARERARWTVGALAIAIALFLAPGCFAKMRSFARRSADHR